MSKNNLEPTIGGERLHTVKEVAAMLGLSDRTVYLWIEAGKLGHYRIAARTIRIGEHHLRKFLRETEAAFRAASASEPVEIDWSNLKADVEANS